MGFWREETRQNKNLELLVLIQSEPEALARKSRIFLVALKRLDRDALRSADEADAHAGTDRGQFLRELDAFVALISAATTSMSFTVSPK